MNVKPEIVVDGKKVGPTIPQTMVDRFEAAVKADGLYKNRSEAVKCLMIRYIQEVEGRRK